jgi:phosphoserine phosphatase RsbU/P
MTRVQRFWQRVTDGMELNQLWKQFHMDARSSYRLYSREIDATRTPGTGKVRHFLKIAMQFFWAVIEKLTPARRILLLVALVFLFFLNGANISWSTGNGNVRLGPFDGALWGGLLLVALLVLEVGDRVVMKRDLQIAKEIQTWLLPASAPEVPGLEIAFATRAANTVAGDYYDVFSRAGENGADGTFLIAVADVAGKSVPAAMLMATFQASLKTLARTPGSLADLVGRMNTYACSNSQNGRRFTTTFVAEYDPASRNLIYVNAGHNPPILRRGDGAVERLEAGGVPIGIVDGAPYQAGTVTLRSGDWLVIFTDGVTEAENERAAEYGEVRLMAVLNTYAGMSPQAMLGTVMQDVDRFVGDAPQHDDVTLLLVKAV